MDNKSRQSNSYETERERFSNFVVDLKKVQQDTVRNLKEKDKAAKREAKKEIAAAKKTIMAIRKDGEKFGRKIGAGFSGSLERLDSAFKKIKPNLLKPRKKRSLAVRLKGVLPLPNRTAKISWRGELKRREDAFKEALRYRVSHSKAADDGNQPAWHRSLFYFSFTLLLIILPFKVLSALDIFDVRAFEEKIVSRSESAVNSLMAAADSVSKMDLKTADADFQIAGANFLEAQDELDKINDSILTLASFSSDPKIRLAAESKKFVAAGASASSLGRNLVLATDSLFSGGKDDFRVSLDNFLSYGNQAVSDAKELKKNLARIDPANLPADYRDKFESLSKQADLLADNLDNFVSAGTKLKEILGLSRDKRYLLVFQNNAEMRASGGFLGSYALVDVRDGKIRNLEVPGGGSYDTEGGMKVNVVAPEPLWLVNPLWHFWDANWWPDWPTTAQNLQWFYGKSGGPSVDGVIGFTPTVVEKLLEITGPIDLTAEYGLTIDKDNFWETVQKITEQKNLAKTHPESVAGLPATSTAVKSELPLEQGLDENVDNKPKKIIGDLFAKILEVLPQKLDRENLVKIISVFEESMSEKQILFYFNDPALESEFVRRNWAGEVRQTGKDYLMVVNTNIAGQKSDRLMSEAIDLDSEVAPDGSIINTLTIVRTHNGAKNEALTGVRNVDWMRIYVPQGSELISADGFISPDAKYLQEKPEADWEKAPLLADESAAETDKATGVKIYKEKGKTVFADWLMVDPGQTATVTIRYRLPFNVWTGKESESGWLGKLREWMSADAPELSPYSLLVQKQPGSRASAFSSRLHLPEKFSIFWRWPENLSGQDGWDISEPLGSDKYYSLLLEKKDK